jgi:hypothetical protein
LVLEMKFLQREHDNSGFDDRGALANLIEWLKA